MRYRILMVANLVQVYEISMSAIIRLECDGDDCEKKGKELVEEEGKLNLSYSL
jgi:hypothetical protein